MTLTNTPGKQETRVLSRVLYEKREPCQDEMLKHLKPYSEIYELVFKNNSPQMPQNVCAPNRIPPSVFIAGQ